MSNAALLHNLEADAPDVGAEEGDLAIFYADGRVRVTCEISAAELIGVILAVPLATAMLAAQRFCYFERDVPSIRASAGDWVDARKEGKVVFGRLVSTAIASRFAYRILSDRDDFESNKIAEAEGLEEAAILESLRELHAARMAARRAMDAVAEFLDPKDVERAAVFTCDVPAIGAQEGDALVFHQSGSLSGEPRGSVRWLRMAEYEALAGMPEGTVRDCRADQWRWESPTYFLSERRGWGKRLKVWHSRLALVKPLRMSDVGEIEAHSDDAALFELLYRVGCRMPG